MKILFVWTGLTSYMGDCWRALAQEAGVELKVVVAVRERDGVAFKAESVLKKLDYEIVEEDAGHLAELVGRYAEWKPDITFVVGWHNPVCRAFVEAEVFRAIRKVCCFDMPWRRKLRCFFAPFVLGRFLRRYDAAFVPGEFCAKYAKWLGFKTIYRGLFGIDTARFARGEAGEISGSGRKRYFLYVGRNSPEKRLEDLKAAHDIYRRNGGTLELKMYGKDLPNGFVEPEEVPGLMRNAASFVLASDFDPWPLVLIEAMSAGCRVIASDKCTNWPELGKNWLRFKCGDVQALARAMGKVEEDAGDMSGRRSEDLAIARRYDCSEWVGRVKMICEEVGK